MATVMTSKYPSSQPPLPARNHPGQSNVTHVKMGRVTNQSNHSLHNSPHEPAPPPLPSREQPMRRKSFETASFIDRNTAKAFSDPDRLREPLHTDSQTHEARSTKGQGHGEMVHRSKTVSHHRAHKSEDTPPPVPASLPPKRPPANYVSHPQMSGSHRHTSGSNPQTSGSHPQTSGLHQHTSGSNQQTPGSHPQTSGLRQHTSGSHHNTSGSHPQTSDWHPQTPPSHPQTGRKQSLPNTTVTASPASPLVHTQSMHSHRRQAEVPDVPPQLPARPPKPSTSSNTSSDFESLFRFHEPCDFPEPETSPVSTDKTYPSETVKAKKNRAKAAEEKLGPL